MSNRSLLGYIFLAPFSWIYGMIVGIRNWMFGAGILTSSKFDVPIITVGNITAGGTGKTPAAEYLVKLLKDKFKVAVVSRGYKRKSSGFVLAAKNSTPQQIGDEPFQIKRKFQDVAVAVDGNRRRAIKKLIDDKDVRPEVIVLDDAFQHRYVSADISILLMDYNRPIYEDAMLPLGMLREPVSSKDRATIIIVTKCPHDVSPMDLRLVTKNLNLYPYQSLFFSTVDYSAPRLVFGNGEGVDISQFADADVIVVAGLGNPQPFADYIKSHTHSAENKFFADHHDISAKEYEEIAQTFKSMNGKKKAIFTTEKDAVKMFANKNFPEDLKPYTYYVPMEMKFIRYDEEDGNTFNSKIISYVTKNKSYMRIS